MKSIVTPKMQSLDLIKKSREYLDYLERHIMNVQRAWVEIQEKCNIPSVWDDHKFWTLHTEIEKHDLSKFGAVEFTAYRQAFYPAEWEKKFNAQHAFAFHVAANPHHWEKWTQDEKAGKITGMEAEVHCTHMVADWLAMSYEFGDTPRAYYEKNTDKIHLPEWAVEYIYELFDMVEK